MSVLSTMTNRVPAANVDLRARSVPELVGTIVAARAPVWRPEGPALSVRDWQRIPYESPVVLQPLAGRTVGRLGPAGDPILVVGRNLSPGGIAFEHAEPLPHRYVAVQLPLEETGNSPIVTQLTWCRFTRSGHYLGGGRFLGWYDRDTESCRPASIGGGGRRATRAVIV